MPETEVLLETRRFRVVRQREQMADGTIHERETVQHPGAVVILPLVEGDRICLIRNYRIAVGRTLLELPAGTLEPGEAPLATARRELEEETGYRAARIEPLLEFFMSPGILNERMHLFVATGLSMGTARLDAGEQIEPLVCDWKEAMDMVAAGQVQDAKTLVGLLYYDRYHRNHWA
jgi:ADP-ribose pyrophosphatase